MQPFKKIKSHNCFLEDALYENLQKRKSDIFKHTKHDLHQLYYHLFNKYLLNTLYEPRAGNRVENKTETVPVFWSQIIAGEPG